MSYSYYLQNIKNASSPLIVSAYSPKIDVSIAFPDVSPVTKQEFKDECDINILMSRYESTGQMPVINERAPQYLDATGYDYQTAMNFVAGANTLFNEMPASIRNRFENDPAQFLDFCSQEKNRPEMQEMGLLKHVSDWVKPIPASEIPVAPVDSLAPLEPTA